MPVKHGVEIDIAIAMRDRHQGTIVTHTHHAITIAY
jgi:hypothetical protein